jgi:hypothetical protein
LFSCVMKIDTAFPITVPKPLDVGRSIFRSWGMT